MVGKLPGSRELFVVRRVTPWSSFVVFSQLRYTLRMPLIPVDRILIKMSVSFDQNIHRHLSRGCVIGTWAEGCARYTKTNDTCSTHLELKAWTTTLLRLPCLQIDSSLTSCYRASSKLETEYHSHYHHGLPIDTHPLTLLNNAS